MEAKIETHNNHESVGKTNDEANLENQRISQTKNMKVFSKGKAGKDLNHKSLSERETRYFSQFSQYSHLKDIDANDKKAILDVLSEDYKNMTSEEKSYVPESFSKIFERMNGSLLDKALAFLSSIFSSTTKVEINGQHFDRVECGGGGDCCFRSIAEALGIGSNNYKIVRGLLSEKMIEAANSKDQLPETLRLALSGVYEGVHPDDDNMCKEALKYHVQNITAKNGRWGDMVDVCFVPQLTGKRVFACSEFTTKNNDKKFQFEAYDAELEVCLKIQFQKRMMLSYITSEMVIGKC